ncbi:hypothetical protein [Duganella rhizosphaerae]|uniref:hypothetical protein n=1 Tax=Duganella rhizosphaerae TaxID=2885763 RepID=UPI00403EFA70
MNIKIEGEFIDSFLYSGTLFLVCADSRLMMYDWEAVLKRTINLNSDDGQDKLDFLLDSRKGFSAYESSYSDIIIEAGLLSKHLLFETGLNEWPTDINVYANRFYMAGENGVDEIPYDWTTKQLNIREKFRVWNTYSYKVSANDSHRIAIAAGHNGIISALPRTGYIKREDVSTLLEVDSNDCQWIGSNLVANSLQGSYLSIFADLPERPHGNVPPEYWNSLETAKRQPPISKQISYDEGEPLYSWLGGSKIFSLLTSGAIAVSQREKKGLSIENGDNVDILNIDQGLLETRDVLSARTGVFGTVIETNTKLLYVNDSGVEVMASRPISWRVFPRAKSYANHLHVAMNDHLAITAYFGYDSGKNDNKFGFDANEIT